MGQVNASFNGRIIHNAHQLIKAAGLDRSLVQAFGPCSLDQS